MPNLPCSQRTFPFRLAPWLPGRYESCLHWLRHLLERLGRGPALAIWQEARCDEDPLLDRVLGAGWEPATDGAVPDVEGAVDSLLADIFPRPVEGVGSEEARALVEDMPPLRQVRQNFPSPHVWRPMTAYEALHLRMDGPARLAEALLRRHGKQGELIVYDLLREERLRAAGGRTGSVAEFIAGFTQAPEEASLFTAGLEIEVLRASGEEIVLHVKECEWARYFRERHPQVGYLMACSTDEIAYRAFNATLRMQRTTTLMEGGEVCDFRIYASG